jgi:hypothetical protein
MNHADARKKTMAKPTKRISIRSSSSQMTERYQKLRKKGVKNDPLTGAQAAFRGAGRS